MIARVRQLAVDRGGLLGLVVLALYIWLAPAHVVDGDNAELSSLGTLGGAAHPSGYPLFLLWLRATSWLPGASPAHTAAIATAILAAASIVVLHAACRAWGAGALAATITCGVFAAAPVVMRISTEAEVFALNDLIAAAVLWLAARGGPLRGGRRAAALGLVAGLGIANHLTCVFVAPIGLLGIVRAVREARPAVLALAAGGLAVGLAPYLYLLVTPDTPMSWGTVRGLDDLVGHLTRRDYGTASLVAHGATASALETVGGLLATFGRAWLWLPLVLGAGALGYRIARPVPDGETRWGWALLAASWLVAGPIFVSRFNARPEGIGLYISQRFHVLPALIAAIPIAIGFDALAARLPARARAWSRPAAPLAATLGFLAAAATSLPHLSRVHGPALEAYARNTLRMLPPDAVMIVYADAFFFSAGYEQWVRGERQDVVVVGWPAMGMRWYAERVAARGVLADPGDEPAIVRMVAHLLAAGRPLFVEPATSELSRAFPSYPFGPLIRILPRGTQPPSLDEVLAENQTIYGAFALAYPRPGPDDEWATVVHQRYATTWQALARKLAAAGRAADAETAAGLARDIGPAP